MELTLTDETASGDVLHKISIQIANERTTVLELIRARVEAEVEKHNAELPDYFQGLIMPAQAEPSGKGYRMKKRKVIDVETQVYIALEAFQRNGFFLLVDDSQCTDLDQELMLSEETAVSFIKLTPLVGG